MPINWLTPNHHLMIHSLPGLLIIAQNRQWTFFRRLWPLTLVSDLMNNSKWNTCKLTVVVKSSPIQTSRLFQTTVTTHAWQVCSNKLARTAEAMLMLTTSKQEPLKVPASTFKNGVTHGLLLTVAQSQRVLMLTLI